MTKNNLSWTQVKKLVKRHVDSSNPGIKKFGGKEYLCALEWSGNTPKFIKEDIRSMHKHGVLTHLIKGKKCMQLLHPLYGQNTNALYIRPKNIKDQEALTYILFKCF